MGILDGTEEYNSFDKYIPSTVYSGDVLNIPQTVIGGAIATLGDIATTTWNSITPEQYNLSTQELLGRVSDDALSVYDEHPDTIQALSFVGGLALPIGLSIKGMNAARAGMKGANWFSDAGKAERLAEAERAFAGGTGMMDSAFKTATGNIYKAMAANALVDSAAAEVAINATMNAHPFMEDYYDNFARNFAIGTAFGGAVGGVAGRFIAKQEIVQATAKYEHELFKTVQENITIPDVFQHAGEQIAVRHTNVENLRGLAKRARDPNDSFTVSEYTIQGLEFLAKKEEANLVRVFEDSAQGTLKEVDRNIRDHYIELLKDPKFAGADKIAFASVDEAALSAGSSEGKLKAAQNLWKTLTNKSGKEKIVREDAVYSPVYKAFFGADEKANYLTAADFGHTIAELEKRANIHMYRAAQSDQEFRAAMESSAVLDREAQLAVLAMEKADEKVLNSLVFHPDDIWGMKAALARVEKIYAETGVEPTLKITITKNAPSWQATEHAIMREAGLDPNYAVNIAKEARGWDKFSLFDASSPGSIRGNVSKDLHNSMRDWINGSYGFFRRGATALREDKYVLSGYNPAKLAEANKAKTLLEEMYHHPSSVAMRAMLQKYADADGNVYLWRGMHGEPKGHLGIESFTILPDKAAEFGRSYKDAVKLYKVKVEDVVGGMTDFGNGFKPEILVLPPTREFGQVSKANLYKIPEELVLQDANLAAKGVVGLQPGVTQVTNRAELTQLVHDSLVNTVKNMKALHHGVESMALRTATPQATVEAILQTGTANNAGLLKYASRADIEVANNPINRAISLQASLGKVPAPEIQANLNARQLDASSKTLIDMHMRASPSVIVRNIADKLASDEMNTLKYMMDMGIGEISQVGMKSTFFRSANSVLEGFGNAGVAATTMGKTVTHIKNELKEQFEKPIREAMGKVAKNELLTIEANTAINVNASISGRRFYKDGQIWVPKAGLHSDTVLKAMQMSDADFQTWAASLGKDGKPMATAAEYRGQAYKIQSQEVRDLMDRFQEMGRHMYDMKNAYLKSIGKADLSDIGLWIPAFNPRDKHIAYVVDRLGDEAKTTMMYANSVEELNNGITAYKNALIGRGSDTLEVITKDMQADFNKVAARHDPMYMSVADASKQHGGSSAATIVSTNTSTLVDVLNGYGHYLDNNVEALVKLKFADTFEHLKRISDKSLQGYSEKSLGFIKAHKDKPADPGTVIANVMLGKSNLEEHAWAEWQRAGQVYTDLALSTIQKVFAPITQTFLKGGKRSAQEWDKMEQELVKKGIPNPFEGLDKEFATGRYIREGSITGERLTNRGITLSNGIAATLLLRAMELGQPLVNAISLPILTSGAVSRKFAKEFAGTSLDETAKFYTTAAMYDGIRLMNHPTESVAINKYIKDNNIAKSIISEATELLQKTKSLEPGVVSKLEDALESNLVKMLSKPSDMAEEFIRRSTFFTGVGIARKAYPGLSAEGQYIFARSFMDEAIGNYHAAQRPAFFQGTFGTAFGLFQTYMLTLAQQIFRGIENRNWAALGKQMFAQQTVFGMSSMPGFHPISEAIGNYFSDNNIDLQTGTFRALPDIAANYLLYGLPSSIGAGVVTRGDISPRVPNPAQGIDSIAMVNFAKQGYDALERVARAAGTADANTGRAMLEAISLQSISRPLARAAELVNGYSLTQKGDVVASNIGIGNVENILTQSTFSRLFATRPLEEIKAREALHLNTLYGSLDRQKRQQVTMRLKSYIRHGVEDPEVIDRLANEYMKTGSATGWRSAVNHAIEMTHQTGNQVTLEKLKKGSPLQLMLTNDMD